MNEYILELRDGSSEGSSAGESSVSKGVLPSRRRNKHLARRILAGTMLTFYELGTLDNADLDFHVPPVLGQSTPNGNLISINDFTLTEWNQLKAKLFEVDLEDWKTRYKKLGFEEAENYGVDIYAGNIAEAEDFHDKYYAIAREGSRKFLIDGATTVPENPSWKESGKLELSAGFTDMLIIAGSGFCSWNSSDPSSFKVTDSNDYDADAVPLVIKGETEVYLIPLPEWQNMANDRTPGASGEITSRAVFAGYRIISREFFLNNTELNSFEEPTPFVVPPPFVINGISEGLASDLGDLFKNYEDATQLVEYAETGTGGANLFVEESPASFEIFDDNNFYGGGVSGGITLGIHGSYGVKFTAGALCGIVRSNGKTYYIWQNTEGDFSGVYWSLTKS